MPMTSLKRQALEQRLDAVEVGWDGHGFSIDKNHVGWLKPWVLHIVLLNSYVETFTLTNSFFSSIVLFLWFFEKQSLSEFLKPQFVNQPVVTLLFFVGETDIHKLGPWITGSTVLGSGLASCPQVCTAQ